MLWCLHVLTNVFAENIRFQRHQANDHPALESCGICFSAPLWSLIISKGDCISLINKSERLAGGTLAVAKGMDPVPGPGRAQELLISSCLRNQGAKSRAWGGGRAGSCTPLCLSRSRQDCSFGQTHGTALAHLSSHLGDVCQKTLLLDSAKAV